MTNTDEQLLARVSDGDRRAFESFYDRHADRVFGFLVKLLRDRCAADDVLQETFLHVWAKASQFDATRAGPQVWLLVIARSRAADYRRRPSRPPCKIPDDLTAETTAPGVMAECSELKIRRQTALASIPPEQSSVIHLAFCEGMTHVEIAEKQQLALGTVKTRIRTGMQRLRKLLAVEDGMKSS